MEEDTGTRAGLFSGSIPSTLCLGSLSVILDLCPHPGMDQWGGRLNMNCTQVDSPFYPVWFGAHRNLCRLVWWERGHSFLVFMVCMWKGQVRKFNNRTNTLYHSYSHLWLGLPFPNLVWCMCVTGAPLFYWAAARVVFWEVVSLKCHHIVWCGLSTWNSYGAFNFTTLITMRWLPFSTFGKEMQLLIKKLLVILYSHCHHILLTTTYTIRTPRLKFSPF